MVSTMAPSGGLFQLSSDPSLIQCSPMQIVEKKLVDLVSNLMEEQDHVLAKSNPTKKMCRWVHDKTMCQLTAGTLKDSAYGAHNDCGFHHNHMMETVGEATSELQRDTFLKLPSNRLMRVITIVLLTSLGSTVRLVFSDPSNSNKEVFSLNTNHNCMHIQNFGCQSHLRHQVVAATPAVGKVGDDSNNIGVRLVFSFCYSIDNSGRDLKSALINADKNLQESGRRGDYTISHVVDALENGHKPTPACNVPQYTFVSYARLNNEANLTVDPSQLLVNGGVGQDKPNQLINDRIPADQLSILATTAGDSFEYKDCQELWQRITSGPFLRHLNRNKIRVRTEHWVKYKKQEGDVELKRATAVFGQAPMMFVQEAYWEGNKEEKKKELAIGDVLSEVSVREYYGIPQNEHTSPPWSCVHDGLMNCIIVVQDYKNDYEGIRAIQQKISTKTY